LKVPHILSPHLVTIPEINGEKRNHENRRIPVRASSIDAACAIPAAFMSAENIRMPIITAINSSVDFETLL